MRQNKTREKTIHEKRGDKTRDKTGEEKRQDMYNHNKYVPSCLLKEHVKSVRWIFFPNKEKQCWNFNEINTNLCIAFIVSNQLKFHRSVPTIVFVLINNYSQNELYMAFKIINYNCKIKRLIPVEVLLGFSHQSATKDSSAIFQRLIVQEDYLGLATVVVKYAKVKLDTTSKGAFTCSILFRIVIFL